MAAQHWLKSFEQADAQADPLARRSAANRSFHDAYTDDSDSYNDLYAETWDTADATRNLLLFPHTPGNLRIDTLAALRGGLVTDSSLRARVSGHC